MADLKHEKLCVQVKIGLGFTSDWMTNWHEFFYSFSAAYTNAKWKQTLINFSGHVKTTLTHYYDEIILKAILELQNH